MPIKDVGGGPRRNPQLALEKLRQLAAVIFIQKRRRRGPDDADPVVPSQGPKPLPLQGGAEAELE